MSGSLGETRNALGSHGRVFPQLFRVLPNFHSCFYNWRERQRTWISCRKHCDEKKENNLLTLTIKMSILRVDKWSISFSLPKLTLKAGSSSWINKVSDFAMVVFFFAVRQNIKVIPVDVISSGFCVVSNRWALKVFGFPITKPSFGFTNLKTNIQSQQFALSIILDCCEQS